MRDAVFIVSLIGLKKSGKTTCVEALVSDFKDRGMKVGTVKSMVHSKFTIDTEGKDTWRHQNAGADFVISLSEGELAYIEKRENRATLEEILPLIQEDTDILICEGLIDDDPRVRNIIVADSLPNIHKTLEIRDVRGEVLAITGIVANTIHNHDQYPVYNCTDPRDVTRLAELIMQEI